MTAGRGGANLRVKKILRFYFSAESLERAFNNVIINNACSYADSYGGDYYAERICNLIEEKQQLSGLWGYLDGVMGGLTATERAVLEGYAELRYGIKNLSDGRRREIKRVCMKFTRRAKRLDKYDIALGLMGKYYCLIAPS